ncbi:hypothetical protein PanWU01x14_362820 [Parasponia andersonii]|uniref:Uncharacterized protein n=1 Tax=Parasponia andersonii TaxID=3476 RepID=A0A2P5A6W3_PARAD|nr:hypothetical protein PanWU01x14_362820 [Parasponia andersonii]
MVSPSSIKYKTSLIIFDSKQEYVWKKVMAPPLSTNYPLIKPIGCWKTWPTSTIGVEIIYQATSIWEIILTFWCHGVILHIIKWSFLPTFSEETRLRHEEWERMKTIRNSQFESLHDSLEAMRKTMATIHGKVTNIDKSHHEEPSTVGRS